MIYIKNQQEIDAIATAGDIIAKIFKEFEQLIKPGVTTERLNRFVEDYLRKRNLKASFKGYDGFPESICTSVNEVLIHGIPSKQKLKNGDIISVDIGVCYKGYHADSARTFPVGNISAEAKRLLETTEKALELALEQVKEGARIGDISNAIQTYVESQGYTLPVDFAGHGVGKYLHEDPLIHNVGQKGQGVRLKEGMVIAIEPMVTSGTNQVVIKEDGWAVVPIDNKLSAHYEHTVLVLKNGFKIFSKEKETK